MQQHGRSRQDSVITRRAFLFAAAMAGCLPLLSFGQDRPRKGRGGNRDPELPAELAAMGELSIVLGRVTDASATLSLLGKSKQELTIQLKAAHDNAPAPKRLTLSPGEPSEVTFDHLSANTTYHYAIMAGQKVLREGQFVTQRAAGSSFAFTIQGDSHPERPQMFDAALYAHTLQSIAAEQPDFHVCMGDDFSIAKLPQLSAESVASRYALQRPFLGIVGQSAPIFLVNGNHEQASLYNYNQPGEAHNAAVWAQLARNKFFPVPAPDRFFGGDAQPLEGIGPLRDYCSWTWGDALFVILDNYWHSPVCVDTQLKEDDLRRAGNDDRKNRDYWSVTIGDEQYAWFEKTLETSRAKYKFVFAHHVLGTMRGGVERARSFEWGGQSRGQGDFKSRRPKWDLPIHQLMVKHGVNIFFQGHDHLYAQQELDGVIYQTVPIPADSSYSIYNDDRYTVGVKHPNSGYLRIHVSPKEAVVEYVRSFLPADVNDDRRQGAVAHRYVVQPKV